MRDFLVFLLSCDLFRKLLHCQSKKNKKITNFILHNIEMSSERWRSASSSPFYVNPFLKRCTFFCRTCLLSTGLCFRMNKASWILPLNQLDEVPVRISQVNLSSVFFVRYFEGAESWLILIFDSMRLVSSLQGKGYTSRPGLTSIFSTLAANVNVNNSGMLFNFW